jgi:uncharacterized NAD(P)/FAD-binding protein YdhS
LERLCRDLEGGEVRSLLHQVRQMMQAPEAGGAEAGGAEAGGADWRDLVDALRPEVPRLWSRLSGDEQLRFRRHLERLWNVYRHRMAPPVAQAVDELQSSGIFFVHAGEVDAVEDVGPALHLQVKLRARARPYAWRTDWLVNCTGPDPHLFERGQPLMDALLARGLARPGPIGMGLGTDERGRVLDAQGQPSPWLWAVGPLRQGQLLESTAVPEIRVQARDIALDIDRSLVDLCTGSTDAPVGACRGSKAQPPTAQLVAS